MALFAQFRSFAIDVPVRVGLSRVGWDEQTDAMVGRRSLSKVAQRPRCILFELACDGPPQVMRACPTLHLSARLTLHLRLSTMIEGAGA